MRSKLEKEVGQKNDKEGPRLMGTPSGEAGDV